MSDKSIKHSMGNYLKIFSELTKFWITLLVTMSAATGYMLASNELSVEIVIPVLGIFFLVSGSSALNQYQERKIDILMQRTCYRPIPSKKIKPSAALFISLGLIFSGSLVLYCGRNLTGLYLSLFAVFWYNLLYTNLKKITAFAVIPGSLTGAIPPAVGWVLGGGSLFNPQILAIAFFFFIWQVPHFWLLLINYGRDYERAGLPSLTRIFAIRQLARITFIWVLASAVSSLLIPLYGLASSYPINLCLIASALWLVLNSLKLLKSHQNELLFRFAFRKINIYAFLIIFLLFLEKLLNHSHY